MSDDDDGTPDDEFRELFNSFLAGGSSLDPEQLAGAAGLPRDPASLGKLMSQLQGALQGGGQINWGVARDQARSHASENAVTLSDDDAARLHQAFNVAALWLDEATGIGSLTAAPTLLSRADWARLTLPLWQQLAEPVAESIASALTDVLNDQAPEEFQGMLANAGDIIRSVGGTLFAMQLGNVVGQLSDEVVSGGDIGIPLLDDGQAALVPQNVAEFGEGLTIDRDQVELYLAVRELAHARLFRHAKWLRLSLITSITSFARGIRIDTERLESLAENFDPSNPEEIQNALASGALIPPKTDEQERALGQLETMLALIEGWVDVVTAEAGSRLPKADAVAETVRRRRAAGGPAESAFATLVGLELRPRRLREAAAMWRAVGDAVGSRQRDELWSHPDLLPTSEDIDDPSGLIARLTGSQPPSDEDDEFDRALAELLDQADADERDDEPRSEDDENGDGHSGDD